MLTLSFLLCDFSHMQTYYKRGAVRIGEPIEEPFLVPGRMLLVPDLTLLGSI